MQIVGISYTTNKNAEKVYTLYVTAPFDAYNKAEDGSRGCVGKRVESIYVGVYDCSALKVGMEIDISYDKAITTARGTFQPIKRIDVIPQNQPAAKPQA